MLTHDAAFAQEAWELWWANHTGPLTSGAIDGVAFPALPYVVNGSTDIAESAAIQAPEQYLPAGVDSSILAGYAMQRSMLIEALTDVTRAGYEIINANDGVLTVANMRPFSRGTLTLNSGQPFDPPIIDPRYASNPVDLQILQAAMDFNQRLMWTKSLSQMDPAQMDPPAAASEDEILSYIRTRWQTEYHPAGTCAMMPLELGGVVSPELLVYGTQNLRVVDSSIMPMLPAAHLQAVVYGVAEKAADIIKAAAGSNTATGAHSVLALPPIMEPSTFAAPTSTQIIAETTPPSSSTDDGILTTFVTVVYTQTVYAPS